MGRTMSCEKFTFESKYGEEITLIVFDYGLVQFSCDAFSASGHQVKIYDYSDHKSVELWTENNHLVSSVNVENYVGRRVEVEKARMQN